MMDFNAIRAALEFAETTRNNKAEVLCYFRGAPLIVGVGWSRHSAARDLALSLRYLADSVDGLVGEEEANASPTGNPPSDLGGET